MKKRVFGILNVPKIRKNHLKITKSIYPAFTIVELLVVIIVIGILAIISLVSYSGISQKANVAAVTADLNNASKQFKMFNIENNTYPTSISDCPTPAAGNLCLKSSDGTSYQYTPALSNRAFCLTATKSNTSYNLTQAGQALAGPCPVLNLDAGNTLSYPGTGTSWYDLSGNNYNGTLNNGVAYQNINAGVMSFDGVDDYVTVTNSSSMNSSSVTLFLWIYLRDDTACDANNNWRSLIRKSSTISGTSTGFDVVFEEGKNVAWDTGTGTSDRWWPAGISVPLSTWKNLVLVYDEKGYKYAYLNGLLKSTKSVSALPLASNASNLYINNSSVVCPNGSGNFPGYISDVRIYDTVLSDSDILQNYSATKGRYGL